MAARAILVAGTSSGAGKSALALALCRILHRRGVRVAPFKAQNMSLNSVVTPLGEEIARAQALQAEACGLVPTADMNPILLKPEGNGRSHVLLLGRPVGSRGPATTAQVSRNRRTVRAAYRRLAARHDVVVIEGAGGAAEINLRGRDIANLELARATGARVLLVGDIDRGGVFAALYGTWALLPPSERRLVAGFVINRARGGLAPLGNGPARLERLTGVPLLGALPERPDLHAAIDPEDGLDLAALPDRFSGKKGLLRIALVGLPRIANFSDAQPLRLAPGVELVLARAPDAIASAHVVLLPGSKGTAADLAWLARTGIDRAIRESVRRGRVLVGLCGGFQMLGERLSDPDGVESAGTVRGLCLFPHRTLFARDKLLRRVTARSCLPFHAGDVEGHEIHFGRTRGPAGSPAFRIGPDGTPDGAWNRGGRVWGTYLHGLFENDRFRTGFLAWTRRLFGLPPRPGFVYARERFRAVDRWADEVEGSLDLAPLFERPGSDREARAKRRAAPTKRRAHSGQAGK